MKVFVTGNIPDSGVQFLIERKYEVEVYKGDNPISQNLLIKKTKNADGIISLLSDRIDKEIISNALKCKIIANYAVGYNNIDIQFAKEKGIVVTNTPDVLTDSTADLAITLSLACARRIIEAEKFLRDNKFKGWKPRLFLGTELKNKIFGILGAGRIGTATAIRAKAFGMKILYCSNHKNLFLEKSTSAKKVSLKQLLIKSDIVSLHLPLNENSYHLLDKNNLRLLKKNSILINTSRGEIIDEKELINILKLGKIRAAGLDVFENEPKLNTDLLKLKNVVLLPHIGSATEEARNKMAVLAAKNVHRVLSGKKPITPVL
jgi:glyoxylate reductase